MATAKRNRKCDRTKNKTKEERSLVSKYYAMTILLSSWMGRDPKSRGLLATIITTLLSSVMANGDSLLPLPHPLTPAFMYHTSSNSRTKVANQPRNSYLVCSLFSALLWVLRSTYIGIMRQIKDWIGNGNEPMNKLTSSVARNFVWRVCLSKIIMPWKKKA
jgi:hypothetical protein